jgi:hypothetical protein
MINNNVLITGTPRSGTTLTCHLLNKLPDTVALHEPMTIRQLAESNDHEDVCRSIKRFCDEQRESIHERGRAISKNVGGAITDNHVGASRTEAGLRQSIASKGEIIIDKQLSQDFMLIIKHPAAFTAVLEGLVKHFPVYAVVRNPLATLAAWSSVAFRVQRGYASAAERLNPGLRAKLAAIDNNLDRQIYLLGWFHGQYRRCLPDQSIIRYESVIESGGRALSIVQPEAKDLNELLESRNTSEHYDYQGMLRIGERLLDSEGAYWEFYTKESVERLLDELRVVERERRSPVFRFDKALGVVRSVKAFFNPEGGTTPDADQHGNRTRNPDAQRQRLSEQRKKIQSKRRELSQIKKELGAAKDGTERAKHAERARKKKQEILELKNELRTATETAEGIPDGRRAGPAGG